MSENKSDLNIVESSQSNESGESGESKVSQTNLPPMIGSKRYKYIPPHLALSDNLDKVYPDDMYAYPLGLNFFMECSLCGAHGETTGFEFAGFNNGWNFCEKCKTYGILQWTVNRYLAEEKLIPVDWLLFQKPTNLLEDKALLTKESVPRIIRFWHKSAGQPKVTREGSDLVKELTLKYDLAYVFRISKTTGLIYVKLEFDELYHPVSLANLFAHNPGLYEEMISCKNYFDNEFKLVFGYDELSDTLKTEIKKMHNISEAFKRGETTIPF